MKKTLKISALLLLFCISFISCKKGGLNEINNDIKQAPTFSEIIPTLNIVDSEFQINGSGFDPVAKNNLVKIGDITLEVKKATPTSLLVATPQFPLTNKISITVGKFTIKTESEYIISDNPFKDLLISSIQTSRTEIIAFDYDNQNKLILKRIISSYPLDWRIQSLYAQVAYFYNSDGNLAKEIYSLNPNITSPEVHIHKIVEYSYSNGVLDSSKSYDFNTLSSAVSNVEYNFFKLIGKQLISKVRKNENGTIISTESYKYSIVNNVPQVLITTDSPVNGISVETLKQSSIFVDPVALFTPGSPAKSLFLPVTTNFDKHGYYTSSEVTALPIFPGIPIVLKDEGASFTYMYYFSSKKQ